MGNGSGKMIKFKENRGDANAKYSSFIVGRYYQWNKIALLIIEVKLHVSIEDGIYVMPAFKLSNHTASYILAFKQQKKKTYTNSRLDCKDLEILDGHRFDHWDYFYHYAIWALEEFMPGINMKTK